MFANDVFLSYKMDVLDYVLTSTERSFDRLKIPHTFRCSLHTEPT